MLKYFICLFVWISLITSCDTPQQNQEQLAPPSLLVEQKLDSIRSVITIILDDEGELEDTRSTIFSGTYETDEENTIRSIRFSVDQFVIDSVNYPLSVDLINLERWDSTKIASVKIDSAFMMSAISHLALSKITIGDVTYEVLFPINLVEKATKIHFEGKTTVALKDWGIKLQDPTNLHLGLSLYTLSEK